MDFEFDGFKKRTTVHKHVQYVKWVIFGWIFHKTISFQFQHMIKKIIFILHYWIEKL